MKQFTKILLAALLGLLSFTANAQETIPDSLGKPIQVNGQFFITIHNGDTAIWHFKGYPYGIERLARYKDLISAGIKPTNGIQFIGDSVGLGGYLTQPASINLNGQYFELVGLNSLFSFNDVTFHVGIGDATGAASFIDVAPNDFVLNVQTASGKQFSLSADTSIGFQVRDDKFNAGLSDFAHHAITSPLQLAEIGDIESVASAALYDASQQNNLTGANTIATYSTSTHKYSSMYPSFLSFDGTKYYSSDHPWEFANNLTTDGRLTAVQGITAPSNDSYINNLHVFNRLYSRDMPENSVVDTDYVLTMPNGDTTVYKTKISDVIETDNIHVVHLAGITDLQAYTGPATTVYVDTAERGGVFKLLTGSTTADNGVVFPSSIGGSYWQRQVAANGTYYLDWFDAPAATLSKDSIAFKKAVAVTPQGGILQMGARTYNIGNQVIKRNNIKIIGSGRPTYDGTTIYGGTILAGSFDFSGDVGIEVAYLGLDLRSINHNAIYLGGGVGDINLNCYVHDIIYVGNGSSTYHGINVESQARKGITISHVAGYKFAHGIAVRSSGITINDVYMKDMVLTGVIFKSDTVSAYGSPLDTASYPSNNAYDDKLNNATFYSSDTTKSSALIIIGNATGTNVGRIQVNNVTSIGGNAPALTINDVTGTSLNNVTIDGFIATGTRNLSAIKFQAGNNITLTNCIVENAESYSFLNTAANNVVLANCLSVNPGNADLSGNFAYANINGQTRNFYDVTGAKPFTNGHVYIKQETSSGSVYIYRYSGASNKFYGMRITETGQNAGTISFSSTAANIGSESYIYTPITFNKGAITTVLTPATTHQNTAASTPSLDSLEAKEGGYAKTIAPGFFITNSAVTSSSAGTLTLAFGKDYVFTGSTTTWTLPALSATNSTRNDIITIKNAGSGNITLNSNTGSTIYDSSLVSSITIAPGAAVKLVQNNSAFYKE